MSDCKCGKDKDFFSCLCQWLKGLVKFVYPWEWVDKFNSSTANKEKIDKCIPKLMAKVKHTEESNLDFLLEYSWKLYEADIKRNDVIISKAKTYIVSVSMVVTILGLVLPKTALAFCMPVRDIFEILFILLAILSVLYLVSEAYCSYQVLKVGKVYRVGNEEIFVANTDEKRAFILKIMQYTIYNQNTTNQKAEYTKLAREYYLRLIVCLIAFFVVSCLLGNVNVLV